MNFAPPAQEMSPAERAELDWLLESGVLGRSANAVRVLRYICEESAAGRADRIKEYTIAVEALGRRPEFNPQLDTIVRVTVHSLRKRLQEVYSQGEGVTHSVRLVIPPGAYAVHFVPVDPKPQSTVEAAPAHAPVDPAPYSAETTEWVKSSEALSQRDSRRGFWLTLMLAGAFLIFALVAVRRQVNAGHESSRTIPALSDIDRTGSGDAWSRAKSLYRPCRTIVAPDEL